MSGETAFRRSERGVFPPIRRQLGASGACWAQVAASGCLFVQVGLPGPLQVRPLRPFRSYLAVQEQRSAGTMASAVAGWCRTPLGSRQNQGDQPFACLF